jgi:microcystin synthetase protein McyG
MSTQKNQSQQTINYQPTIISMEAINTIDSKAIATGSEIPEVEKIYQPPSKSLQGLLECYPKGKFIYIEADGQKIEQTYSETWLRALSILAHLRKQGIKPGSFIIFQLEHPCDFITCFWSCMLGGFVPVLASMVGNYSNSSQKVNRLAQVFPILNNPYILTTTEFTEKISLILNLKDTNKILVIDSAEVQSKLISEGLKIENDKVNLYYHQPEDLGFFLLSSGTTGKPKIITFNARTLRYRLLQGAKNSKNQDQVALSWLPLEHIGGIRTAIPNARIKIYFSTNTFLQDPLIWLDTIEKYQVTHANSINFALSLITESLRQSARQQWNLSSIKQIGIGAETIKPQTLNNFLTSLAPFQLKSDVLRPGYGMSECGVISYADKFTVKDTPRGGTFVEVGQPATGHSIRIVNDQNEILKEKEIGQIQVIGPTMTSGYYENPELNHNLFTADGWINTGDLGFLENGSLTVTGREKEVIVINAYKYPSDMIEIIAEEMEEISKGYTVALAIRRENSDTDELALFFHTSLSKRKNLVLLLKKIKLKITAKFGINPMYLIPLEKTMIPRTATGKIKRLELKTRFEEGQFSYIIKSVQAMLKEDLHENFVAPSTLIEQKLVHICLEVLKVKQIGIQDNFFELDVNSLSLSQILSRIIETFELRLPLYWLFEYPTIKQLAIQIDNALWFQSPPSSLDHDNDEDNIESGTIEDNIESGTIEI